MLITQLQAEFMNSDPSSSKVLVSRLYIAIASHFVYIPDFTDFTHFVEIFILTPGGQDPELQCLRKVKEDLS